MSFTAASLASRIDHTLLKPEATEDEIDSLCDEAIQHGFAAVCVNPIFVARVARRLAGSPSRSGRPEIAAVVGFPLGATPARVKEEEARLAVGDGATEIDLVIHLGGLIAGARRAIRSEIEAVAGVVHRASLAGILKVILETAALSDEQIIAGCRAAAEGEADYVKTSTGFHPAGGATVQHVALLHRCASPLKVKAAGGIRDATTALAMLRAGAARIGTSASVAIVRSLNDRMDVDD